MAHLRAYPWPGNVRELRNVCERAAILSGGTPLLDVPHFPLATPSPPASVASADPDIADFDLERALARTEARYLRAALAASDDNKTRAAVRLGVSERTLWYKLKKHGLRDADSPDGGTP